MAPSRVGEGEADLAGEDVAEEVALRHGHAHLPAETGQQLIDLHVEAARVSEAGEGGHHLGERLSLTTGHVEASLHVAGCPGRDEVRALGFAGATLGEHHQARAGDDECGGRDSRDGPARESASAGRSHR